jgi:hypothetical protein
MSDELNGRRLHVWRGQDLVADVNALMDAIVASGAEIYNRDGRLVHLDGGKLVPVPRDQLPEIIGRHLVTKRPVNRGTADEPHYEIEYSAFSFAPGVDTRYGPDDRVLTTLHTGRGFERLPPGQDLSFSGGGLLARVLKVA